MNHDYNMSIELRAKVVGLMQASSLRPLKIVTVRDPLSGDYSREIRHEGKTLGVFSEEKFGELTVFEILKSMGVAIHDRTRP